MPSADEVKQSITNWCSSDDDLEITNERFEPGTDFAFGLKAGVLSSAPVELVVLEAAGADRVTVRRSLTLSGDNVTAANQLIASRPGSVTAAVERSGGDTSVVAQTYVYLDGLSKHTFVQAVAELARTSTLLDGISSEVVVADQDTVLADMPADGTTTEAAADAEPASTYGDLSPAAGAGVAAASTFQQPSSPASQPLPQPSFTPQPVQPIQAQPTYMPTPVQQPYQAQPVQAQPIPQPAASQWAPSHSVPPQGLRAWGAPDPAGPVVANLAPGLPIQVAEVRGAWARVICSNGWTGWIDGRIIGVAA
jgi:SH3 domain-containing protein